MEKVSAGDVIKVGRHTSVITEVIDAYNYGRDDGWYIEYINENGKYHYWKQGRDGGHLIKKGDK